MIDMFGEPVRYFGRLAPFGHTYFPHTSHQPSQSTGGRYGIRESQGNRYRGRATESCGWKDIPIEIETTKPTDDLERPDEASTDLAVDGSLKHTPSVEEFPESNDVMSLSKPWVSGLFLTHKDRSELQDETQLSDKHIFAAQKLLHRQFPNTRGLQDTCLSQTTFPPVVDLDSPGGVIVQIHHTRGNHWVVSAFVDGEVLVYDSLYINLAPDLVKQLKEVYKSYAEKDNKDHICKVLMPRLEPQKGGNDCGTYAVAYAYELCCGRDPTELHFDQKQMRKHLKLCFNSEELSRFPIITFLKRDKSKDNVVYV